MVLWVIICSVCIWRRCGCEGVLRCGCFWVGGGGCFVWGSVVGDGDVDVRGLRCCAQRGSGEFMGRFSGGSGVEWVVIGGAVGVWAEESVVWGYGGAWGGIG